MKKGNIKNIVNDLLIEHEGHLYCIGNLAKDSKTGKITKKIINGIPVLLTDLKHVTINKISDYQCYTADNFEYAIDNYTDLFSDTKKMMSFLLDIRTVFIEDEELIIINIRDLDKALELVNNELKTRVSDLRYVLANYDKSDIDTESYKKKVENIVKIRDEIETLNNMPEEELKTLIKVCIREYFENADKSVKKEISKAMNFFENGEAEKSLLSRRKRERNEKLKIEKIRKEMQENDEEKKQVKEEYINIFEKNNNKDFVLIKNKKQKIVIMPFIQDEESFERYDYNANFSTAEEFGVISREPSNYIFMYMGLIDLNSLKKYIVKFQNKIFENQKKDSTLTKYGKNMYNSLYSIYLKFKEIKTKEQFVEYYHNLLDRFIEYLKKTYTGQFQLFIIDEYKEMCSKEICKRALDFDPNKEEEEVLSFDEIIEESYRRRKKEAVELEMKKQRAKELEKERKRQRELAYKKEKEEMEELIESAERKEKNKMTTGFSEELLVSFITEYSMNLMKTMTLEDIKNELLKRNPNLDDEELRLCISKILFKTSEILLGKDSDKKEEQLSRKLLFK